MCDQTSRLELKNKQPGKLLVNNEFDVIIHSDPSCSMKLLDNLGAGPYNQIMNFLFRTNYVVINDPLSSTEGIMSYS